MGPAFPERNVLCHLSGSGRKRFCPPGNDAARIRLFRCPVHPGGRIVGRPGTAPVAHEAVCERALFAKNLTKKPQKNKQKHTHQNQSRRDHETPATRSLWQSPSRTCTACHRQREAYSVARTFSSRPPLSTPPSAAGQLTESRHFRCCSKRIRRIRS